MLLILFSFSTGFGQTSSFSDYLAFTGGDPTIANGGNFVEISDHSSLDFDGNTSFTIQFWLNPQNLSTTANAHQGLVTKKTKTGIGYGVFWNVTGAGNGRFQLALQETGASGGSSKTISTPTVTGVNSLDWIHITAVVDRNSTPDSAFIYVNGQLVEDDEVPAIQDLSNSNPVMLMNFQGNSSDETADGFLDEVRIWNTALNFRQIHRLYSEPIEEGILSRVDGTLTKKYTTLSWNNLVAYLDMEDPVAGFTVTDKSSQSNDGVFYGGTTLCALSGCGPEILEPLSASYSAKPTYEAINSGTWSNTNTWKEGEVPNTSRAIVNVIDGVNLILDGNYECETFNLSSGASFTLGSTQTLSIDKYFDIDGTFNSNFGKIEFVGNGNHTIEGDGSITFFDLEINQSSSQLQVNQTSKVNGRLLHTNGKLRTKGNLTIAGSNGNPTFPFGLIDPSGSPDIEGNIFFEVNLSNTAVGWKQMCMPGLGTIDDFTNLTLNTMDGPKAAWNNVSYWDNSEDPSANSTNKGWTGASSTLNQTNAFAVYLDFVDFAFTNPVVFDGEYSPGDKSFLVTHYNDPGNELSMSDPDSINGVGWNFIPNNYPSLLDGVLMYTENNLSYKYIHIWDSNTQQYRAFADVPAFINPYGNAGISAYTPFQSIKPFQGFWVNASSSENGTTFTLKNSWRHSDFTKTPHPSLKNFQSAIFHVYSAQDSTWDGTGLVFDNSYHNKNHANEDALKIISTSNVPTLYTNSGKGGLYLNKLKLEEQKIALGFKPQKDNPDGIYFLSMENQLTEEGWHFYLLDNHNDAWVDLTKNTYTFKSTDFDRDRFTIYITRGSQNQPLNDLNLYYSQNKLVINNYGKHENANILILDLSGRVIWSNNSYLKNTLEKQIDLNEGIYCVYIETSTRKKAIKVIVPTN